MFKRFFLKKSNAGYLWAATDIGSKRKVNQDNFLLNDEILIASDLVHYSKKFSISEPCLYAICDGMGGGALGEQAAFFTAKKLYEIDVNSLSSFSDVLLEKFFVDKLQHISDLVYREYENERVTVGCTATLFYADKKRIFVVNVGDSPCFLCNKNELKVITYSDNRANLLYKMGQITEKERWNHVTKNQLTQHIGVNPSDVRLSPHVWMKLRSKRTEYYLLCTDGLIDKLSFEEIVKTVHKKTTDNVNIAEKLVQKGIDAGSKDNVTAVLIRMGATLK